MRLETRIVSALEFFGHMDKNEIRAKLQSIGVQVEMRDLDRALHLLVINKMIRKTDFDSSRYIATGVSK